MSFATEQELKDIFEDTFFELEEKIDSQHRCLQISRIRKNMQAIRGSMQNSQFSKTPHYMQTKTVNPTRN